MILPDVQLLIYAFWLGAALSVCFAVLECVRLIFRLHKFTVFIADILFCLFCTGCTFLLALAGTNGFLRLYWFAFEVAGFFCVHITFTFFLTRYTEKLVLFLERKQAERKRKKGKRRKNSAGIHTFFQKRREKNEKKT